MYTRHSQNFPRTTAGGSALPGFTLSYFREWTMTQAVWSCYGVFFLAAF
jgi:hypothetical protein